MAKTDTEADRTRFILSHQAEATIVSIDACYCAQDREQELCNRDGFIDGLAADIAEKCSPWQIENAILVLQKAHEKCVAKKVFGSN